MFDTATTEAVYSITGVIKHCDFGALPNQNNTELIVSFYL